MADRTVSDDRLAALGAHLSARRLDVELTSRGLRVENAGTPGCCEDVPIPSDVINCRTRVEDGGRPWFFTSWNEPIAEAGRVTDAAVFILGYLHRDEQ
ncbi:hypothetical protein ACFOY4_24520 [Actinomadura syzygii]|uniref:Uncharacterized protein n=1 Tax=Actinomadura syzygii TaxID=1427538 RepID=A0A5D0UIT9_9ACTN|nr:hypothetical protein [Actinomadura syzygii]TYC18411.1 hypothetical protein FXF65_01205 [Actinomadura syzygii]